MNRQLTASIPNVWNEVRLMRGRVDMLLDGLPRELRDATTMTSSELLENAIKYGEPTSERPDISFKLTVTSAAVRIEVANGVQCESALTTLGERIRRISESADKQQPYLARLEQLLADPKEVGGLGLYRIAYEGNFGLQYAYADHAVTVIAVQKRLP